jgi:hypothetical protein
LPIVKRLLDKAQDEPLAVIAISMLAILADKLLQNGILTEDDFAVMQTRIDYLLTNIGEESK